MPDDQQQRGARAKGLDVEAMKHLEHVARVSAEKLRGLQHPHERAIAPVWGNDHVRCDELVDDLVDARAAAHAKDAQIAALREKLEWFVGNSIVTLDNEELWPGVALELQKVLADTESAARAHDERLRAEGEIAGGERMRESAAKYCAAAEEWAPGAKLIADGIRALAARAGDST